MSYDLYFDGGCKKNGKKDSIITFGVIIYKVIKNQKYLFAKLKGVDEGGTNNDAEYLSLIYGLKYMYSKKIKKKIYVFGDSKLVIDQVNGKMNYSDKFEKYINQINFYKSKLDLEFIHIYRESNFEADQLGNEAYREYKNSRI